MADESFDAVIVGAGHNGLVAAFYLARAGRRVVVLEEHDVIGGACVTEELIAGVRFSTCAGVLWKLSQRVIEDMGLRRRGLRYQVLDPGLVNLYEDRSSLAVWGDTNRTEAELSRLSPGDAPQLANWVDYWDRATALLHPFLLSDPPSLDDLRAEADAQDAADVLESLLTEPLGSLCERHFRDERVQAAFVHVDDVGDPWIRGGALVEAYSQQGEQGSGAFVAGGMGAVTGAMAQACVDAGVELRTNAKVERILVSDNEVRGVRLHVGRELQAATVISNADPTRTARELLGEEGLPDAYRDRLAEFSADVGYFKFFGLLAEPPDLSEYLDVPEARIGQVRIAPSLGAIRAAYQDAQRGELPTAPIVYLHLPTGFDPTIDPRAGYPVSAFVRYAPIGAPGHRGPSSASVRDHLLNYVARFIPNFESSMGESLVLTPSDVEGRVGITNGNIHHVDHAVGHIFGGRLESRSPVSGLYLCGAATHPGGEVTGMPGYNAARVVLEADLEPAEGAPS